MINHLSPALCLISETISLSLSLMYDAVMVFATAIQQLGTDQVTPTQISCDNPSSTWNKGYTILNYMKNVTRIWKR